VGVHLEGDLRDSPLVIPGLTFAPHGWQARLSSIWSEWTGFRGWSPKSINFLRGSSGPIAMETLSPVLAGALWAGSALLILAVFNRFRGSSDRVGYVIAVAIPWILIDLLWQRDLTAQLDDTRHLFAGKSIAERHLADIDGHIYQYARRLKGDVLPPGNQKIFILHDSSDFNFERLKMQYYLLPHNVFNYGKSPPKRYTREGDLILVLGQVNGLDYDDIKERLVWGDRGRLPVELVDMSDMGSLYRVRPRGRSRALSSLKSGDSDG
jgi:hypothetical protein